jgi:hypothetical protein
MTNIIIGADIVPTKFNMELFINSDVEALFGKGILDVLEKSDLRIFNLETPLCNVKKPIPKCGPNLIAPTASVKGISAIKPSLLCLANNHILDHDEQALFKTIEVLDKEGINHCGAGKNLEEAKKPFILYKNGLKIGVYTCAEHEFTIATENSAGANPYEPLESFDHVSELRKSCDYVIVLYHGGREEYRYPSPNTQKVCRKFIEKGADLIITQHTHCIGCYEDYKGSTIVYGQGNFMFIYGEDDSEEWQTSILVNVKISDDKKVTVDYIPLIRHDNGMRLSNDEEGKKILDAFYRRSKEISEDPDFVKNKWREYCSKTNMIERLVKNFTAIGKDKDNVQANMIVYNMIHCEIHREVFEEIMFTRWKQFMSK